MAEVGYYKFSVFILQDVAFACLLFGKQFEAEEFRKENMERSN